MLAGNKEIREIRAFKIYFLELLPSLPRRDLRKTNNPPACQLWALPRSPWARVLMGEPGWFISTRYNVLIWRTQPALDRPHLTTLPGCSSSPSLGVNKDWALTRGQRHTHQAGVNRLTSFQNTDQEWSRSEHTTSFQNTEQGRKQVLIYEDN